MNFITIKKLDTNAGVILTSQSGETADTIAAMRRAQDNGLYTVAITNETESTMMNDADDAVLTQCGPETAILGTKNLFNTTSFTLPKYCSVWKILYLSKQF